MNISAHNIEIISVVLLTYNGEKYLQEILDALKEQRFPLNLKMEIIVIDSGSTDATLNILKTNMGNHSNIRLIQIPNEEFGHGKTRQMAASIAGGEIILYLTQDATPADSDWIINMLEPFYINDNISCVLGNQIPRKNAPPCIKREIVKVFNGLGDRKSITLSRYYSILDHTLHLDANPFFSDVNSGFRKQILLQDVPFEDVNYAEDQLIARAMLNKGYIKAYNPMAKVFHSHDYGVKDYYRRKFQEQTSRIANGFVSRKLKLKRNIFFFIKDTWRDWFLVLHDTDYNSREKIRWLMLTPAYNFALMLGKIHAVKYFGNNIQYKKRILKK
ncbi:MAG TPA: glycosyltransferase family 2 protein [Actinobacteria bacterium]|nr:glycosyltransferase family 2 protein [Actinomycetota bacterium]